MLKQKVDKVIHKQKLLNIGRQWYVSWFNPTKSDSSSYPMLKSQHQHDHTNQGLPLNSVLVVPHCGKQKTLLQVLN